MAAKVNGFSLAYTAIGGVVLWSGIKGETISATFKGLLSGTAPSSDGTQTISTAAPPASASVQADLNTGTSIPGVTVGIPAGVAAGGSAAANQNIAKLLAAPYGWSSGAQWAALVSLWESESSWSNTIWNTTAPCDNGAHAYGIPQACGHGVVKAGLPAGTTCPYPAGNPGNPPACGGVSNAIAQITWGLAYIKAQYGSPVNVPHGGY